MPAAGSWQADVMGWRSGSPLLRDRPVWCGCAGPPVEDARWPDRRWWRREPPLAV